MTQLEEQYPRTQFVHADFHVSGALSNPDAVARGNYYPFSGAPSVWFDGYDNEIGGGQNMYPVYAPIVANHLANDLGKLSVVATLTVDEGAGTGTIDAQVIIADGETIATPSECRIRCVVYENNIVLCCDPRGNDDWNGIGRDMLPEVVLTADAGGETQDYDQVFSLSPGWNADNLHAVVFVQRNSNRRSLNASFAFPLFDLTLETLDPLTQEIEGSVVPLEWDQEVMYTGATTDDVIVTLDKSTLPAGWDAELEYQSTTYPTTFTIPAMTTGQAATYQVRILSDGSAGVGTVNVTAEPASLPTASENVDLNAIVNSQVVLFVDDDQGGTSEVAFESAIADAGYTSITHNLASAGSPTASYLSIFDAVVWTTGGPETDVITFDENIAIRAYLDAGGKFFLSSHGFLDGGLNSLSINYFKVGGRSLDVGAVSGTGLAGDVLGDGLAFPLAPPFLDKADKMSVATGSTAAGWLLGPAAPPQNVIGIRYDSGIYKTVFMCAAFEGIPVTATATDPNNQKTVMKRILDWFLPAATDVNPELGGAVSKLQLSQNAPNPFSTETTVRFAVPTASPVSLQVFDVTGRKVATLVDRAMDAGAHSVVWNGRDDSGSAVATGVYLVRLQAAGETVTSEMVRMK